MLPRGRSLGRPGYRGQWGGEERSGFEAASTARYRGGQAAAATGREGGWAPDWRVAPLALKRLPSACPAPSGLQAPGRKGCCRAAKWRAVVTARRCSQFRSCEPMHRPATADPIVALGGAPALACRVGHPRRATRPAHLFLDRCLAVFNSVGRLWGCARCVWTGAAAQRARSAAQLP